MIQHAGSANKALWESLLHYVQGYPGYVGYRNNLLKPLYSET